MCIYDYTKVVASGHICADPIRTQSIVRGEATEMIGETLDHERRRVVEHESLSQESTDQAVVQA